MYSILTMEVSRVLKVQMWSSYFSSGGVQSCSWRATVLQSLDTHLNTPATANQALNRHTRNFQAGVLRQVGAKLCRTAAPEFGHPDLHGHGI